MGFFKEKIMLNITEVTTKIDQSDLTEEAKRILIDVVEGCTEANGEKADRGDVLDALCDGAYLEQIGADDQAAVEQAYTFALSL